MIGSEVAHYKILDRLGGGGMGVVYKAEDTRLGRTVALKLLNLELLANDSLRKRFLHEARAASSIDHPNVCHVYEVGEADGRYYMAMSYCDGPSLRDIVRKGPVDPRRAFSIAFGIAQGLWAAHRRGIVHRDIKPANVILTDDGFVRIVDFGLALLIGDSRVTTSGVTVGTVAYMSPEQTSDSTVTANTDIWSLGVTLYELLTGHLPFRGDVNAALVYSIVHEPHTPLPDSIPAPVARVVDRCLEKDPSKRYQTTEELLEDMVKAAQELGWESSVASATIAPILRERRRKILTRRFAIGAAVLAVLGGAFAARTFYGHSIYTTKTRLAVLPFDNLLGAENEALVDGLSDHVARVAQWVARGHRSMWTVTYANVVDAQLPKPSDSVAAFGVNRLIRGAVQRIGNNPRLLIQLVDARSGRTLHKASLPLDIDKSSALLDSLSVVLGTWFKVAPRAMPRGAPWRIHAASAIRPYLEGLSFMRRGIPNDTTLTAHAMMLLERSAARDSLFAYAAYAAGNTELTRYRQSGTRELLDRALRHGRIARRETPTCTEAHMLLGGVFRALDRPDSAEACLRFAASVDPANITLRGRLGDLYVSQNRVQEAETSYSRAVEMNRDNWIALRVLGVFYYGQHRLDDAASAWGKAIEVAPHDVLTLNNLGVVHYDRGEWHEAQQVFLQAFKIHPNCESCNNVAGTLFLAHDFKTAAKYFELALSPAYCDTVDYVGWGNWGSALYWTDDGRLRSFPVYRRAIARGETTLKVSPDSPNIIADLVDYYAMTEDSTHARAMIARAEPYLEKDEKVMYRVGSAYEKLGERDLALHELGNAVRHGYALSLILADPVLHDLVHDVRFDDMVRNQVAAEGAEAARNAR